MTEGIPKNEEKKKIKCKCLSCNKEVEVVLIPYGSGHIAICPECRALAYSDPKLKDSNFNS